MSKIDTSWLFTTLDCGDNNCLFRDRSKPGGMRTNGGCRCFKDLDSKRRTYIHRLFYLCRELLKEEQ